VSSSESNRKNTKYVYEFVHSDGSNSQVPNIPTLHLSHSKGQEQKVQISGAFTIATSRFIDLRESHLFSKITVNWN
jgi:hypothetical protein